MNKSNCLLNVKNAKVNPKETKTKTLLNLRKWNKKRWKGASGTRSGMKGKKGSVADNLGKKPQIKGTRVGLNSGHFSYEPGALSIVPPVP